MFCFSLCRPFNNPPKRHGVGDVGGVAGIDDVDVIAGVSDVGRVLGGGHGALLRRRPWGAVKRLRRQGELFPQRGAVAQERQVYENDRQQKVIKGCEGAAVEDALAAVATRRCRRWSRRFPS